MIIPRPVRECTAREDIDSDREGEELLIRESMHSGGPARVARGSEDCTPAAELEPESASDTYADHRDTWDI